MRHRSRYPHVFSKGRGVAFVGEGSRRGVRALAGGVPAEGQKANPCLIQTQALGQVRALSQTTAAMEARQRKLMGVSPTVAGVYQAHLGLAVICVDCLRGVGHKNAALPDQFKRQWRLTLLEIERRSRCALCNSRNARVYPWWGGGEGGLTLSTPPKGWR